MDVTQRRPIIVLALAVVGMAWFSRGLTVVDTVALLACGLTAGGSLAALATARRRAR